MRRRTSTYPISVYLSRAIENFSAKQLCSLLGYKNGSKLFRRLDEWLQAGNGRGDFLEQLGAALWLKREEVEAALEETRTIKRAERAAEEAERQEFIRRNFVPYIAIETELRRPTSITMAAVCGGRMKYIKLIEPKNPLSRAEDLSRIVKIVVAHFADSGGRCPLFGRITGYRYVRTYEESVRFDINGALIEVIEKPFRPPFNQPLRQRTSGEE